MQTVDRAPIRGIVRLTTAQLRLQRRITLLFTILPPIGLVTVVVMLWGRAITATDLWIGLGFYLFTGFGITVGYHRLFTHRAFRALKPVRVVLAIAGSMALEGSIIAWVATHRRHHAYADDFGDPHSPHLAQASGLKGVLIGLWYAHVGWLFDQEQSDHGEWAPDLVNEPAIARINGWFGRLTTTSLFLPPLLGYLITGTFRGAVTAFLWGSLARIMLLQHVTWSINSICHFYGKEAYVARDESKNVWPMSIISFGESWHNNHHAFPWSARLGLRPWQIDPGWYVIRTLEKMHLIKNVKVPTRAQMAAKRLS